MTAPHPDPDPDLRHEPQWGIADAAVGFLVALFVSGILGRIVLSVAGVKQVEAASIGVIALLQATLWVGLLGAPVVATRYRGNGLVEDLGLRFKLSDLGVGAAIGVSAQLILVPAISYPWLALLGKTKDDLAEPAERLAGKADDPLGVILLVVIIVIGAPIVEELFFRGLLLRAVNRKVAAVGAVTISAVVFGLVHFQTIQFPALVAFGVVLAVLAVRTGRLGPAIISHAAFNATTVVALLLR